MDNRFCAFHLITIMADTVPTLAQSLANDKAFQIGAFRLMFNMYIRAVNPLNVQDDQAHHPHIQSSSDEPKIWLPQWRYIISCLIQMACGWNGIQALMESWQQVAAETQAGAEKVKVKEAMISEVLLRHTSEMQEKKGDLDPEEEKTLVELSRLVVLISTPEGSTPQIVEQVKGEFRTRDWRLACGGCGSVQPSEVDLLKCENCKILVYCSETCRQSDWERYHGDACRYRFT